MQASMELYRLWGKLMQGHNFPVHKKSRCHLRIVFFVHIYLHNSFKFKVYLFTDPFFVGFRKARRFLHSQPLKRKSIEKIMIHIYIYTSLTSRPRISGLVEKPGYLFNSWSSPGFCGLVWVFTVYSGYLRSSPGVAFFFGFGARICFPTLWKENLGHFRNFTQPKEQQVTCFLNSSFTQNFAHMCWYWRTCLVQIGALVSTNALFFEN